ETPRQTSAFATRGGETHFASCSGRVVWLAQTKPARSMSEVWCGRGDSRSKAEREARRPSDGDAQRRQTERSDGLVRKGGLEPPRYCYRQPLQLVRLPIPPLSRGGRIRPAPWRQPDRRRTVILARAWGRPGSPRPGLGRHGG